MLQPIFIQHPTGPKTHFHRSKVHPQKGAELGSGALPIQWHLISPLKKDTTIDKRETKKAYEDIIAKYASKKQ